MTAIITASDGHPYQFVHAVPEPVFVAEMPRTSHAHGTPHTGHATLLAYLDPVRPSCERLALLRLRCGRLAEIRASAICPATAVATRRLGPATAAERRTA